MDRIAQTIDYLKNVWGIDKNFARKLAPCLWEWYEYGLRPIITSGYRSQSYQAGLARKYSSGDRSIVFRPATKSLHTNRGIFGPAALAVDVSMSDPYIASQIASRYGILSGLAFGDPVHFYVKP